MSNSNEILLISKLIILAPNTSQQPVIAPMTPRTGRFSRSKKSNVQQNQSQAPNPSPSAALARAESYEDEFPYVDISEMVSKII